VETDKKTLNLTRTGRLLDSEKQIEILFNPKLTFICTSINNANRVIGIPDTYLAFGDNVEKYFPPKPQKKLRTKRQTKSNLSYLEFKEEMRKNFTKRRDRRQIVLKKKNTTFR
jgi:hypothetical protein